MTNQDPATKNHHHPIYLPRQLVIPVTVILILIVPAVWNESQSIRRVGATLMIVAMAWFGYAITQVCMRATERCRRLTCEVVAGHVLMEAFAELEFGDAAELGPLDQLNVQGYHFPQARGPRQQPR